MTDRDRPLVADAAEGNGALAARDVANAHTPFPLRRWLMWGIALIVAANFLWVVAHTENFGWPIVARWLTAGAVIRGLGFTLGLSVVSMLIGVAIGLPLAVARMSNDKLFSWLAAVYIWFFRGTPLLVQLLFWYNLSTLFPRLGLGIPFGPMLISWDTNSVITPMTAAIAGLALNEAAYMAEIIRGGLLSVDPGQVESTEAFGMTRSRALMRVILPQAMRAIIPPTGNQFINLIKATSLVSVIAMSDLLYTVQAIYNRTFEVIPMLMVAVLWYLLVTSILNVGQAFIERYYARGQRTGSGETRLRAALDTGDML